MTKIDHLPNTSFDQMWADIKEHIKLPASGPWSYQFEQHRRWHWLDYMIEMGAYPVSADDWDWVYMLGRYADQANCVFWVGDDMIIHSRLKEEVPSDA